MDDLDCYPLTTQVMELVNGELRRIDIALTHFTGSAAANDTDFTGATLC